MIVKSIATSFAVTLTSAFQFFHGHELTIFVLLYGMHLLVSVFIRGGAVNKGRPPVYQSAPAPLQSWTRLQRNSYTSF